MRVALSWMLYGLGRLLSWLDRLLSDRWSLALHPAYSWAMRRSERFQQANPRGPWPAVKYGYYPSVKNMPALLNAEFTLSR